MSSTSPTLLSVNQQEIRDFVDAVFRNARTGYRVVLRAFREAANGGLAGNRSVTLTEDRAELIEQATYAATQVSKAVSPSVVFCPPTCTFKPEGNKAREADLAEGLVLSVELDSDPETGLSALAATLGTPTLVIESGGLWSHPGTAVAYAKLHAYWRLSEPATSPERLHTLKVCRRVATAIAGGDPTNITLVHPIRWPGSWHRKNPDQPRLAQIARDRCDASIELTLNQIMMRLKAAAPDTFKSVAGDGAAPAPGERSDKRDTKELIEGIVSGEKLHPNLAPLNGARRADRQPNAARPHH